MKSVKGIISAFLLTGRGNGAMLYIRNPIEERFLYMAVYGYCRCSTNESKQDINRQIRELKQIGVDEKNIYWEYESGTKTDRIQLNRLLDVVQPQDTIRTCQNM